MPTDFAPLKEIHKFLWGQGDFAQVAGWGAPGADALVEHVNPGDRVLDVAAGTGNVAIAAARRGARVTACDLTPVMVERGRELSAKAGVDVEWAEADAEALPYPEDGFDAALSSFGVMFTPQPELAAAELFRVVRAGGTVALTAWTPDSFVGRMMTVVGKYIPAPPADAGQPLDWGREDVARERLAPHAVGVALERRSLTFSAPSPAALWDRYERVVGPMVAAKMLLGDRYRELSEEGRGVLDELGRTDGDAFVVECPYLVISASAGSASSDGRSRRERIPSFR